MTGDYLILPLVAAGVFLFLLRALPDSALNGQFSIYPATTGNSGLSTRLSRTTAVAISVGLLLVFLFLLIWDRQLAPLITMLIVTISLWAAVDSHRIGLRNYRTRLAVNPILLFNLMYLLWPVVFPWYLVICSRIGDGTLARKETSRPI